MYYLPDLEAAVAGPKFPGMRFDSSCFSGRYVTGLEDGYLEALEARPACWAWSRSRDGGSARRPRWPSGWPA